MFSRTSFSAGDIVRWNRDEPGVPPPFAIVTGIADNCAGQYPEDDLVEIMTDSIGRQRFSFFHLGLGNKHKVKVSSLTPLLRAKSKLLSKNDTVVTWPIKGGKVSCDMHPVDNSTGVMAAGLPPVEYLAMGLTVKDKELRMFYLRSIENEAVRCRVVSGDDAGSKKEHAPRARSLFLKPHSVTPCITFRTGDRVVVRATIMAGMSGCVRRFDEIGFVYVMLDDLKFEAPFKVGELDHAPDNNMDYGSEAHRNIIEAEVCL